MPEFAYTARDLSGQRVTGTLDAASERDVIAALSGRQLFPMQVSAKDKKAVAAQGAGKMPRVKPTVVAPIYSQLAALLRSGVPLLRSLQVLEEQSSNASLKLVLSDVRSRVEDGATLSEAMSHSPKAFDELSRSIIRAGGEGGFMEDALERVAAFTEQQAELRARVIGALAYPMVLIVIGTLIVSALLIFLVPTFEEMFASLAEKGELPWATTLLLALSGVLSDWRLLVAIIAVFMLLAAGRSQLDTPENRRMLDRFRLKLPVVSDIYLSLAVSRFCRVLGTLLSGGVPIVKSLDISADSTGNLVLSDAVREASENISSGQSLAEPLAASGHFPRNVTEMIAVAEQSNNLEVVLKQIADNLERSTWRKLDVAVRLIEPILLVFLAGAVLFVVYALLVPVMKMAMTV